MSQSSIPNSCSHECRLPLHRSLSLMLIFVRTTMLVTNPILSATAVVGLNGTESRTVNHATPRIANLESPEFPQRESSTKLSGYGEQKTDKEKSHIKKGIWWWECPGASRGKIWDAPGTPGTFGLIYVEIHIQGAECPRDRRDRRRDRWDMSTGQTGHTHTHTGAVPPKFFMFIGFLFFFPSGIAVMRNGGKSTQDRQSESQTINV